MNKKWEVIFDYLMHLIRENKVKAGETLPSQNMLKTKYKFSEQPIRMAFNKLIELQIVKAVNGKGYVVQNKLNNNLLFSFNELFPNSISKYYNLIEMNVDEELAKVSNFAKGTKVIKYNVIRNINPNEPAIFQETYILKKAFDDITLEYLNKFGFLHYLESKSEVLTSHASKKIKGADISNNKELIKIFGDKVQSYILDEGNLISIYGEILEYRLSYYNPKYFNWEFIEWRK